MQYLEKYSEHKKNVNIPKITDKSASTVVQYTIHVNIQGESYTVNIYTTTSRLLVNGNRADIFLNNDIPAIHQLIQNGLDKNCLKGCTIEEINKMLGDLLEALLQTSIKSPHNTNINETNQDDQYNSTCPRCNKQCKTRSALCTKGKRWIHYRCQKLTNQEIQAIEQAEVDENYTCNTCNKEETLVKVPEISQVIQEESTHLKQLITEEPNMLRDLEAPDHLGDATQDTCCIICDHLINTTDTATCTVCDSFCHQKCLSKPIELRICIGCSLANKELETDKNDNETCQHKLNKPIPLPRKSKTKSQEKDDTKPKTSDNETVKTKTSELRARELKLRKSEEQLKLKEKSMQEYRNEKIMLEIRCQQLEARNFELEQTVKLLKRRLECDETMSSKQPEVNKGSPVHSLKPENQSNYEEDDPLLTVRKHLNNRMANLQTKLTNIVFDEMEKQLDKIKPLNNDDINQTTQIITNNSSQSMRTEADIRKPLNKQPEVDKTLQDLIGQPIIFSKAVEPPRLQNSMKKGSAIGTLNEHSRNQQIQIPPFTMNHTGFSHPQQVAHSIYTQTPQHNQIYNQPLQCKPLNNQGQFLGTTSLNNRHM